MEHEYHQPSRDDLFQEAMKEMMAGLNLDPQGQQPVMGGTPLGGSIDLPSMNEAVGTLIFDMLTRGLGRIPGVQRTLSQPLSSMGNRVTEMVKSVATKAPKGPTTQVPAELEQSLGQFGKEMGRGTQTVESIPKLRPWDMPEAKQSGIYDIFSQMFKKIYPYPINPPPFNLGG